MEILVAMVLLATVGAVSLSLFSSSTQVVQTNRNTAINIARGYLEIFYQYVYVGTTQPTLPTPNPLSIPPVPGGPFTDTVDGVTYTTNYTVDTVNINGDSIEDYRKVTMTVSWP